MTPEEIEAREEYLKEVDLKNQLLQRAYHMALTSPDGKIVVGDFVQFCFGMKSTFDADARVHAKNEGRREVLMRVLELTGLTLEEIYTLHR